jgi:hypothetical protein
MEHLEAYLIQLPPEVAAALISGGVMPKSWVPRTAGRGPLQGSGNPLTSVLRGIGNPGGQAVRGAVVRTGTAGVGVVSAGIGGYNVGVLVTGFFYAAIPGSNGL